MVGEQAQFRMVGSLSVPAEVLKQKPANVELAGAVPRSEMREQYRWADVFLLPSLCEGSAAVTYEAMMAGLPVICSENTGSIVEDSVTGFIVPLFDSVQVAKCLLSLARKQDMLAGLSAAAQARAESVGISAYRRRLLAALKDLT
jgi:glycosyltransferase involved in cell wall biosynthesis